MRNQTRRKCIQLLQQAQSKGDSRKAKRIMAVLAVVDGGLYSVIANTLKVSEESIRLWVNAFLLKGVKGFNYIKPPGKPSKLTKTQRKQLDKLISQGPQKSGFPGACWRSPMIQWLIYEKFGVEYSVNYIPQLLKSMGFSYQKAKFVADHKDPEKRKQWLEQKWPDILKLAERQFFAKKAYRITVYDLPSYSPDYNPIEKLWKKIKEKEIHLHYFPTFNSLKNKVEEALLHFKDLKNEVLSLFGFYNKLAEA